MNGRREVGSAPRAASSYPPGFVRYYRGGGGGGSIFVYNVHLGTGESARFCFSNSR